MKKIIIFLLFISWFSSGAQTVEEKIREVYADKTQELVINVPEKLKMLTSLIQERIKVALIPLDPNDKYPKLSNVPLLNLYNPAMKRDDVFHPETFNPLKYDFVLTSENTMIYRVDYTDYVIIISPKPVKP